MNKNEIEILVAENSNRLEPFGIDKMSIRWYLFESQ